MGLSRGYISWRHHTSWPRIFLKIFIMKFETVVYEKLIEIVRRNTSIYDFINEHNDFILQKNILRRLGRACVRACVRAPRSSDDTSGRSQPCGDANQLAEDQTHGHHPQSHQPSAFEDMQHEVLFVDSFTYLGSLITNDDPSSRDITSRIAKAASAMYRL